ncbi:hypothetical protein PILCRDRAFT_609923 [Piloderma croceum F 1598]|uniref:Uncharacterized protein n=1 Tax=Piloderma croceum (strain F 1598) TaxID=765440 RepID=A0A0C3FDG9_PILCF|nr:hypothetical protein PILCRDRAFT_609923 [Piloderma croceum F 1598]
MSCCVKANTPKSILEYSFRVVLRNFIAFMSRLSSAVQNLIDGTHILLDGISNSVIKIEDRRGALAIPVEILYKITAYLIHQSDVLLASRFQCLASELHLAYFHLTASHYDYNSIFQYDLAQSDLNTLAS